MKESDAEDYTRLNNWFQNVATALAGSLDKLLLWAVGLFFTNPKLSLELYTAVIGIYEFNDRTAAVFMTNIGSEPVSLLGLEKRNAIRSTYFAHYRRRQKKISWCLRYEPGTGNSAGRNININKDRRDLRRSFYLGILLVP